ncbi:MAG TPA: hypothetical protein PKW76_14290 [bacterium]|nr:hypothetical protein [bacterium]HPG46842.1 hypothetical protein [bacterium]HPM99178.1 hypothetical protein [bacterium]
MKKSVMLLLVVLLFAFISQSAAQYSRKSQFEVFAGAAIPLAPDEFKDYYKLGVSVHGQYVFFPAPNLGLSIGAAYESFIFDGDKILEDYEASDYGIEVEGSASIIEIGLGIRPYLTPPESMTQFFLFAMGTYNLLSSTIEITADEIDYSEKFEGDEEKPGVAVGAGVEMPASDTMNVILQGLVRFIFTDEETTSFVGVTAGLVF